MRRTHTGGQLSAESPSGGPLRAPSADRNLAPILGVLRDYMPASGQAVEFASGTGQHIAAFAKAYPDVVWTPTEVEPERLASIRAWRGGSGLANLEPPLDLNIEEAEWPFARASLDVALTVNLLHLISEDAMRSLFDGVARTLKPGGTCFIYGPFQRAGQFVSEGDRSFHASLAAQDPSIGYKNREAVEAMAVSCGLTVQEWREMPANNLMLVAVA